VKHIMGHKMTQAITAIFILLGVYIIMYPPDMEFFRRTSEFAVHSMFGFLLLGFVFLIFNQSRLMFISLLASGLLAFYLKTASNSDMTLPARNHLPKLTVAHFNLSSFDKSDEDLVSYILDTDSDLISFQEYTPDWDPFLSRALLLEYPNVHRMVRIDLFGIAIYSKKPLKDINTFYYEEIPNIEVTVHSGIQDIHIISSYIAPPSITGRNVSSSDHLSLLADHITEIKEPVIILGDFHQVYWTQEIKDFRKESKLHNSRRDISIISKVPYDHIFYSRLLECIGLQEVTDHADHHLGISGMFQSKTTVSNPAILRTAGLYESNQ